MQKAQATGDKTRATFEKLGVSRKALMSGNTQEVLLETADGPAKVKNPMERLALTQQLFGRTGRSLLPILLKGRKGIQENLDVVKKYGAYLGVKTADQLKTLLGRQRELHTAQEGMKIQLGIALLPLMLTFSKIIMRVVKALEPLLHHTKLLTGLIMGLAAAIIAYQIAMVAATIATTVFETAAAPVVLITLAVVAALALLVVGVILVIKHWSWLKKKAMEVWGWIKTNWPLLLPILLGPFGLAATLIIRHFGQIKTFVLGVVDSIKAAFRGLLDFVRTLPAKMGGYLKKVPGLGKVMGLAGKLGGLVPHFAAGGRMPYSGTALVGERGPELVHLPRGALVSPHAAPAMAVAGIPGAGAGTAEIIIPLYLDGKHVARSVARVTADKLARR